MVFENAKTYHTEGESKFRKLAIQCQNKGKMTLQSRRVDKRVAFVSWFVVANELWQQIAPTLPETTLLPVGGKLSLLLVNDSVVSVSRRRFNNRADPWANVVKIESNVTLGSLFSLLCLQQYLIR